MPFAKTAVWRRKARVLVFAVAHGGGPHEPNPIGVCFAGDITVVIETKLDLRDGAAWSQIDKAINRLEGGEGAENGEEGGELRGDSQNEISDPGFSSPPPPPPRARPPIGAIFKFFGAALVEK